MKLVLKYESAGDIECGSYKYVIPFEYESKEKAEYDLLTLWEEKKQQIQEYFEHQKLRPICTTCTKPKLKEKQDKEFLEWVSAIPKYSSDIKFLNTEIVFEDLTIRNETGDESYCEPEILTLEEWWEKYKQ